jgi:cytidyltransferase-like protein
MTKKIIVATGGGFDPLHEGHIRLFKEAKKLGDVLVVMLNSDEQLKTSGKKLSKVSAMWTKSSSTPVKTLLVKSLSA